MEGGFNHLFIVTHTDLDGVGSAAAMLASTGRSPGEATILYAEPYNVHESLETVLEHAERGDLVAVSDLGPNRRSFPRAVEAVRGLTGRGVRVEWYDHHVWSPDEQEVLRRAGATLVVDTSTCATGVVARNAPRLHGTEPPAWLPELERAVCAADLWRWDHPLAPKLFRVADARHEDGREAWRNRLVEKLATGTLWDSELEEKLQEYITLELANYGRIMGTVYVTPPPCRVAAAYKERGPPSNSFIGASLLSRYRADIAVIVRSNGAVSLRSRTVDVQVIAKRLGGGGHPRAAGAKAGISIVVRIASVILGKRRISRSIAKRIRRIALREGLCQGPR